MGLFYLIFVSEPLLRVTGERIANNIPLLAIDEFYNNPSPCLELIKSNKPNIRELALRQYLEIYRKFLGQVRR